MAPSRALATLVLPVLLAGALAQAPPAVASPVRGATGRDPDPLAALVHRMDAYLQRNEVDGVTMDWRYEVSPSEEIRQTVVCQLLAYVELYRDYPTRRVRRDIVEHADFMIGRLEEIRSHSPFDGMLAYALLGAYEATHEARFLERGAEVVQELLDIPTSECVLNGGLMVAMATAAYWRLTGDPAYEGKTRDIVAGLEPFQNPDGSFPHWCRGSRDIHYTGWMAMELIHIERMLADARIPPMLARMNAFLEGRIGPDGRSRYTEPCPGLPGCTLYYYSRASGCGFDYDTRGWTVEPAYNALLFDRFASPQYAPVMEFLLSIENGGTFADLYDYWPPPEDPEYPWTIADTSVVCMSINFWVLATELTGRAHSPGADPGFGEGDSPAPASVPAWSVSIEPNPVAGPCRLRFTLAEPGPVSLTIHDASGRLVRALPPQTFAAGEHFLSWDGRDLGGRPVRSGVYFVRLRMPEGIRTSRLAVAR